MNSDLPKKRKMTRAIGAGSGRLKTFFKWMLIAVVIFMIAFHILGRKGVITDVTMKITSVTTRAAAKFLNKKGGELKKEKNITVYGSGERDEWDHLVHEELKNQKLENEAARYEELKNR